MEVHAVPVVSQRGHLPLPVLQEGDGPEGHEDAEEDGARVVEQVAHLPAGRGREDLAELSACWLKVS